jgi:predicted nucleotidyltransferase component of viral defense system
MAFPWGMNVLDQRLVEDVAARLRSDPGLIEKDWQVTRALGVIAVFDHGHAQPAFAGGTSLSKGWGLIKRFSEDIDFKVAMPPGISRSQAKKQRSTYREQILAALCEAGFTMGNDMMKRDESRFFSANLLYPSLFAAGRGLRPHIRVEMSMTASVLPPVARPIASLITVAQNKPPEISAFLCVQPVETAADKLSALAWRVHARRRGGDDDDPTIIRHLHDLAALKDSVSTTDNFPDLALKAASDDEGRGGVATTGIKPEALFNGMLERLATDPLWAQEYRNYVQQVSYADIGQLISFDQALVTVRDLVALIPSGGPS